MYIALMQEMIHFIQSRFRALADPRKAGPMAAYMKTDMPFHGIQKPQRVQVFREMKKQFPIESAAQYKRAILALWNLPHREEKYAAISIAQSWPEFMVPGAIPLYRRLIVEGAWWDFVDDIAIRLTGIVWLKHRPRMSAIMDKWIDLPGDGTSDGNMWLRRAAIIGQIKHFEKTDEDRLFDYCLRRAHEKEFFIRKAIGWALRAHAYTNPRGVKSFLLKHREKLSPLSFREGGKHLGI
jgi:3-methyladenine DNA glycosylase AlkD